MKLSSSIHRNSASNKSLEENKKSTKKTGRISLGQVFRRSLTKENPGCLFGLPLSRIMDGDNIPKPVAVSLPTFIKKIFYKLNYLLVNLLNILNKIRFQRKIRPV